VPYCLIIFAPSAALKIQELIDDATEIILQLKMFVDYLALFVNSREDMEGGLFLRLEFNEIAEIWPNQTKSVYCPISCPNLFAVFVNNIAILPSNKHTKQCLLKLFLLSAFGICNSLHYLPAILKKKLLIVNNEKISPQRLSYIIKILIWSAVAYQFLIAPCSLLLLKRLSSTVSSAV
jgi:hypothetical protein